MTAEDEVRRLADQLELPCFASRPITVWCSEHVVEHAAERVVGVVAAGRLLDRLADRDAEAARASRGRAPGSARPEAVSGDGLGITSAPNRRMKVRRYGFWSWLTRTM